MNNPYQSLIATVTQRHGLPAEIVTAVCSVESAFNALAVRFEPAVYSRLPLPRPVAPCSAETERWARAASWGLLQVMGQTARGLGFDGAYLSALSISETGLEYGCQLLAQLVKLYKPRFDWPGVVAAYNAGHPALGTDGKAFVNQDYVDKVALALGGKWPA